MKTMTCTQLGGACEKKFDAETFEEIAEKSREHAQKMVADGDPEHMKAMQAMRELMKNPDDMEAWFEEKRKEFKNLPETN